MANILFTRELARRWEHRGVTANAVHPGWVASDFGRDGDMSRLAELTWPVIRRLAKTPEQGARTQVYVASAPELDGVTGGYWAKSAPATPSAAPESDTLRREIARPAGESATTTVLLEPVSISNVVG